MITKGFGYNGGIITRGFVSGKQILGDIIHLTSRFIQYLYFRNIMNKKEEIKLSSNFQQTVFIKSNIIMQSLETLMLRTKMIQTIYIENSNFKWSKK
jgi:hypothetical protein